MVISMNNINVNELTKTDNIFLIICSVVLLIGTFTPDVVLGFYEEHIYQTIKQIF